MRALFLPLRVPLRLRVPLPLPLPLRERLVVGSALVVGALGYLLLGTGPSAVDSRRAASAPWELPPAASQDLATAKALWTERVPWGAAASGAANEPPPPQSLPVGVLVQFDGLKALFALAGGEPVVVPVGGALLDGGIVTSISRSTVTWNDGAGKAHEFELFVDPLPAPAAGVGK